MGIFGLDKFLHDDITTLIVKTGEEQIEGIFGLDKFLHDDITTLIDKTGEEQIENNLTSAIGYSSCMGLVICKEFAVMLKNATPGSRLYGKQLLVILGSKNDIQNGYKLELTTIKLYRNIINNETCRLMISIGMVAFKANQLFGLEKTRIFFDLLDEKLFNFEKPGIISEFVLNMAQYAVRKYVISFFDHASDIMNNLTQLLLCCPVSESLQKMTEKEFTSLMPRVIDSSSLKTRSNKGAKPSLKVRKGTKWIKIASEEFVRAMGGEISEDVSYRLRHKDEMIVHKFIDTRRQPSDGRENRPIHSNYFPPDCRLFISIPTENGSYWHQLDTQKASRIRQHK